jgi:large subunit ribosomal protein L13
MRTVSVKPTDIQRRWYVVNAEGQSLGRLASRIALVLRGKNRPEYTYHTDCGDFVVVVNCEKIRLTGAKLEGKIYQHHTGHTGNLREASAKRMLERKPEFLVKNAVRGMLPRTPLARLMLRKLKVYAGPEHPHAAQKPESLDLTVRAR